MTEILEKFKANWMNLKNEDELKIFRKFAKEGRFLIVLYSRIYPS